MTVNNNNRVIGHLTVMVLLGCLSSLGFAAGKNILRIHFQTAFVKPSTQDTVLNVYYKLEIGRPPVKFNGYDCRFIFENTKIQPVPMKLDFFSGTASQYADFANGVANPPDEYRVQVLSTAMLDTTNPILFQVRYTVLSVKDSAEIIPTLFNVTTASGSNPIDTVIIDNSPGRDDISWYVFGLMFADTAKPSPPKKADLTFTSDSTTIQSDSVKVISVQVSTLDTAKITNATFEFDVDTSAIDSVSITGGALLANASFGKTVTLPHVFTTISSVNPLQGQGELLRITLRGKKLKDTLCTGILNPKFTALNADEMVGAVKYLLKGFCVLGKAPKDTTTKSVVSLDEGQGVEIYPNPASSFIDFKMPINYPGSKHVEVFDMCGRVVLDEIINADFHWETVHVPNGVYSARIISPVGRGSIEKTKILIIH
jgi:hypothetical protein